MVMMKGVNVREARHLGWRNGDPERDVNLEGKSIGRNYVAIVRLSDCKFISKNKGKLQYDPKGAPCIPINHVGFHYGYGKVRMQNRLRWFKLANGSSMLVSRYASTAFYIVRDGIVYQGSLPRPIKNDDGEILHVLDTQPVEQGDD